MPIPSPSPAPRLAINGYGRIGRCFLRALHESTQPHRLQVVAINEPANLESMAYLTRYDSTHGRFPATVEVVDRQLQVAGRGIQVSHGRRPEEVDWSGIDLVVECSGIYGRRAELERFIAAGCPRLLLSHPGASAEDIDATVIAGFNPESLDGSETLVSAASCTTNAIVPILDLLDREIGIDQAHAQHPALGDERPAADRRLSPRRPAPHPLGDAVDHPGINRTGARCRTPAAATHRPRTGQGNPSADD